MSVIDRLNRLVRSNLNDMMSRTSEQRVHGEVQSSIREARAQLVECRVMEKRLRSEYESLLDEASSWEERAMLALRSNDEPLARKALHRKYGVDKRLLEVKARLDEQRSYMVDLSRSLDAMEVKLEGLRERTRVERPEAGPASSGLGPGAYSSVAQSRQATWEAEAELGTFGLGEELRVMDEMAARVATEEARIQATEDLDQFSGSSLDVNDDEIESKFRALEVDRAMTRLTQRGNSLDDLKRRLEEE